MRRLRAMSFRRRMVLLAAGAVAAAVVLASVVVYFVTRSELIGQIDVSLRQIPQSVQVRGEPGRSQLVKLGSEGKLPKSVATQLGVGFPGNAVVAAGGSVSVTTPARGQIAGRTVRIERRTLGGPREATAVKRIPGKGDVLHEGLSGKALHEGLSALALPPSKLGPATGYVQLYLTSGNLVHSQSKGLLLPVTNATRAVAAGRRPAFYSDVTVQGTPLRMFVERAAGGGVWQAALPLGDIEHTLSQLRLLLALVCLGGIALAAVLGLIVSRAALIPVRRLTGAAERVARTQDLGHRIDVREGGELGRLAGSFNTMLAALEGSRLAQRQLVSDASHELRTPLTSLRANLDALALGERLPVPERARVVSAVQEQLLELTVLMGDLVDLSKTEVDELEIEDVRLDLAAADAVRRARLHAPACPIVLTAEPCLVRGSPARLDRAIANLLDNACQWTDAASGPVEVSVQGGVLAVRDHGPGIAEKDLPRVFDRFYRSADARARPGSGLGLAIVRQVAELHGGAVHAVNDPDGGARLTLELPSLQMSEADRAGWEPEPALHDPPRIL
jgi:two-component system sensor histidine kinase MprB